MNAKEYRKMIEDLPLDMQIWLYEQYINDSVNKISRVIDQFSNQLQEANRALQEAQEEFKRLDK